MRGRVFLRRSLIEFSFDSLRNLEFIPLLAEIGSQFPVLARRNPSSTISENTGHDRGGATGFRSSLRLEDGPFFEQTGHPEDYRQIEEQIKSWAAQGGADSNGIVGTAIGPDEARVSLPDRMYRRSHGAS